jgi:NAD(P)-dependent dehydrogenase (short-subunit alcohol dehydrogenase family)
MTAEQQKIALVTGANRGIGHAIARRLAARGLLVILSARDRAAAEQAAAGLPAARPWRLDVRDRDRIPVVVAEILEEFGRIDVLVNNAGIQRDGPESIVTMPFPVFESTLETNLLGPLALTQAVLPAMQRNDYGRIVNMSSSLGALADMLDPESPFAVVDSPAYRFSKGALNLLTALCARHVAGTNILVNSACPGWVRAGCGSERAPLSAEEGADTPVWLATLPEGGPSGGFFRERQPIPW